MDDKEKVKLLWTTLSDIIGSKSKEELEIMKSTLQFLATQRTGAISTDVALSIRGINVLLATMED